MDEDGDMSVILGMLGAGLALASVALLGFTREGLLVSLLALTVFLIGPGVGAVRWLGLRRRTTRQVRAAKEVEVGALPAAARPQVQLGVGAVRKPGQPKGDGDLPELKHR